MRRKCRTPTAWTTAVVITLVMSLPSSGCLDSRAVLQREAELSAGSVTATGLSGDSAEFVKVSSTGEVVMRWGGKTITARAGQTLDVDESRTVRVIETDPSKQTAKVELTVYKKARVVWF